ncbi:MAG: hypothetical protein AB7Y74_00750 [Syntrophorhabdus sp.]
MRAGTIVRWLNFPEPNKGGDIKARWFIYLGKSTSLVSPIFYHFSTTTTQIDDFRNGGKRYGHPFLLFRASDTPFDQDCIIDFMEQPYHIGEEELTGNTNIEFTGELSADYLRAIYDRILKSSTFSRKVILDIHDALNNVGITRLKMPK